MLKVARDRLGVSYLGRSSLQRPQYGSRSNHLPGGERNQRLTLPGGERERNRSGTDTDAGMEMGSGKAAEGQWTQGAGEKGGPR